MSEQPIDRVLPLLENVKQNSSGYMARCPAHEDRNNSLSVKIGNDGRVLLKCHAGCVFTEIVEALGLEERDFFKNNDRPRKKQPVKTYDYRDENGQLRYQVCRFHPKEFRQRRPDGNGGWIWNLKGVSFIPYRLPQTIRATEAGRPVFICEGEKDVENLVSIGLNATCNSAGAGKWKADFNQYFTGADVVILPDNDGPGKKHAEKIARSLSGSAERVRVLELPDLPEGGDVSDWLGNGGSKEALLTLVECCPEWGQNSGQGDERLQDAPFQCLGYDHGIYYYLPHNTQQIVPLTADKHTKSNLITLAPRQWWHDTFGDTNTFQIANDTLFRESERIGLFDRARIRGCGAWFDNGRIVLNLGNQLVVNGVKVPTAQFKSRYIYEIGTINDIVLTDSLPVEETRKLLDITQLLSWEHPSYAYLLAGWCVLAPICGALNWRPHIWITGSAGTGKTWVVENIIRPLLGPNVLFVQGNTTEAGIRQTLGNNAYPVIFDEAESENRRSQTRIEQVLELVRQASSESGAAIIKGSQSGHAVTYLIRSCFGLSSIRDSISQAADATRISVLELKKVPESERAAQYDSLKHAVGQTLTKQWCSGLLARSIRLIPVIRKNADTFATIIAKQTGSQREGDQLGTLLAGTYALLHDNVASPEEAERWIESIDLTQQSVAETDTDEINCLNVILQQVIQVQTSEKRFDSSVGNLIAVVTGNYDQAICINDAEATLKRTGIKIENDNLIIANKHEGIKRFLSDTPWSKNWGHLLKRIDGATATEVTRFETGIRSRATAIPLAAIYDE